MSRKLHSQFAVDAFEDDLLFDEWENDKDFERTNVQIKGDVRTFYHRPEVPSALVRDLARALSLLEDCSHGWAGGDSTHELYQYLGRIMKANGIFEHYEYKKEVMK